LIAGADQKDVASRSPIKVVYGSSSFSSRKTPGIIT
jgi:hypothetical protein